MPSDYNAGSRKQVRRKGDAKQADTPEGNEAETKWFRFGRTRIVKSTGVASG